MHGNRTEWSPIRSVIIRVINKLGSPICLITSMITDQIERHEVLLLINHNNFNKICDIQEIPQSFLLEVKKSHLSALVMTHTV